MLAAKSILLAVSPATTFAEFRARGRNHYASHHCTLLQQFPSTTLTYYFVTINRSHVTHFLVFSFVLALAIGAKRLASRCTIRVLSLAIDHNRPASRCTIHSFSHGQRPVELYESRVVSPVELSFNSADLVDQSECDEILANLEDQNEYDETRLISRIRVGVTRRTRLISRIRVGL